MRWIWVFFLTSVFSTIFLEASLICEPVVNVYCKPEEDTELESQALYGSRVEILETVDGWAKIRMTDGAKGWVLCSQVAEHEEYEKSERLRPLNHFFAHIYRVKDTTPYPPLLTLSRGSRVLLDDPIDTGERWLSIELISGEKAWIQRGDVDFSPKVKTMEEMLFFSFKFLGLPYTWGGTSSYGFDCSGFIQMLFKEMGIYLPRNSYEQAASDLLIPVEKEDLQRGDLVFFGETKIVHVGLYLGDGLFIHSGVREMPIIMISRLDHAGYHYQAARRLLCSSVGGL